MTIFRKLSAGITAKIDCLVGQMQNHQALVDQTIREVSSAACEAQVHLRRVRQQLDSISTKIEETDERIAKWIERAKESAGKDKDVALRCLERKRELESKKVSLEKRAIELGKIERKMAEDQLKMETNLGELKARRSDLISKEKSSFVSSAVNEAFNSRLSEVQEVFDSWEISIGEYQSIPDQDPLEQQFESVERKNDLEQELAGLIEEGR